ncbi:hypothetical protein [Flexivirga caeni]|uniref:hypothetical protein n=1 Tax=Flexivirga caeni TaxID=2294115 RepID=UPI001C661D7C|nr:hypothetical protein [Flexivirga caeni]
MPEQRRNDEHELVATLLPARFSTYLVAAGDELTLGLELYAWNARVASALMLPAHFAEVATRNAVADALSKTMELDGHGSTTSSGVCRIRSMVTVPEEIFLKSAQPTGASRTGVRPRPVCGARTHDGVDRVAQHSDGRVGSGHGVGECVA